MGSDEPPRWSIFGLFWGEDEEEEAAVEGSEQQQCPAPTSEKCPTPPASMLHAEHADFAERGDEAGGEASDDLEDLLDKVDRNNIALVSQRSRMKSTFTQTSFGRQAWMKATNSQCEDLPDVAAQAAVSRKVTHQSMDTSNSLPDRWSSLATLQFEDSTSDSEHAKETAPNQRSGMYRSMPAKTRPLGEAVPTGQEGFVVVASTSEVKIAAVRRLLDQEGSLSRGHRVEGVKAPSGVNAQPFGHEETLEGAVNRLEAAKKAMPGASFYVSVENGIFEVGVPREKTKYFDLAWVVVETSDQRRGIAHSVGIEFPREYVEQAAQEGFDKTTVGEKMRVAMADKDDTFDPQDPHRYLSQGRFGRSGIIAQALAMACGQLRQNQDAEVPAGEQHVSAAASTM